MPTPRGLNDTTDTVGASDKSGTSKTVNVAAETRVHTISISRFSKSICGIPLRARRRGDKTNMPYNSEGELRILREGKIAANEGK